MKPIKITEEMIEKILASVRKDLQKDKIYSGTIKFEKKVKPKEGDAATLFFTKKAWNKVLYLISYCNKEVAWHMSCKRGDEDEYICDNVFIYPQKVTGSTVETDQEEYEKWLDEFDDETFESLKMQCHSHVNMSVTPSTVDREHQKKILSQMKGEDFYVFGIFNKKLEYWINIYDMKNNTLYESEDVYIEIIDEDNELQGIIDEITDKVKEDKPTSAKQSWYKTYYDYGDLLYEPQ